MRSHSFGTVLFGSMIVPLVMLGFLTGCGNRSSQNKPRLSESSDDTYALEKTTPNEEVIPSSTEEIVNEFRVNTSAAVDKYAHNRITVQGQIAYVGEYNPEKQIRTIGIVSPANSNAIIQCSLKQKGREPGRFTLGQRMILSGIIQMIGPDHSIELEEVHVDQEGPQQSSTLSTIEIAREYLSNPQLAQSLYQRKTIFLNATVREIRPNAIDPHKNEILLHSLPGISFVCFTNSPWDDLALQLKPGDKATFVGNIGIYNKVQKTISYSNFEVIKRIAK